jgi:hypothetical protein
LKVYFFFGVFFAFGLAAAFFLGDLAFLGLAGAFFTAGFFAFGFFVFGLASALKERGGSSRQAILKYIMANFNVGKDAKSVNAHLKLSLRAGVKNKSLKQSKGTGASGSFRIGEVKAAKKPAKAKKAAKPKAAKPKKSRKPAAKKAGLS